MTAVEVIAQQLALDFHGSKLSDLPMRSRLDLRRLGFAAVAALRGAGFAVMPREATDAMLDALIDGCGADRIQGFQYGDALVIRDVWQPRDKQEIWRGPADPRAEGEQFSSGPLNDAFQRRCVMERKKITYRAMVAAAEPRAGGE